MWPACVQADVTGPQQWTHEQQWTQQQWTQQPWAQQPWTQQPPAVLTQVPQDEPYVVRPNGYGYAKLFCSLLAALLISPVVVWVVLNLILGPPWSGMSLILWISVLFNAGIVGFVWWVASGGGPRLAVGPHGLWLRSVNWPVQAINLAWPDIQAVWLSPRSGLCVQPRDPDLIARLGQRAIREARSQSGRHGCPLVVPLGRHSDRPIPEVLAAVTHWAAGRTQVIG